jgi:hypothetical protein
VLLPLALLVLTVVELLALRDRSVMWEGIIVAGLCALLVLLGRLENRGGGLEGVRVPEILRVDRI